MAIMCIGQSAYDILVPMQGSIIENQKYRIKLYGVDILSSFIK